MDNENEISSLEERDKLEKDLTDSGWPPALAKACVDSPYTYYLGLKNGQIFTFEGAERVGDTEWVHLVKGAMLVRDKKLPLPETRGIDVRLADISWAADAES